MCNFSGRSGMYRFPLLQFYYCSSLKFSAVCYKDWRFILKWRLGIVRANSALCKKNVKKLSKFCMSVRSLTVVQNSFIGAQHWKHEKNPARLDVVLSENYDLWWFGNAKLINNISTFSSLCQILWVLNTFHKQKKNNLTAKLFRRPYKLHLLHSASFAQINPLLLWAYSSHGVKLELLKG